MSALLGGACAFLLVVVLAGPAVLRLRGRRSGEHVRSGPRRRVTSIGPASRRWGALASVAFGGALVVLVGPLVTAGLAGLGAVILASVRRSRRRAEASARARCLPELVDLFSIAASSGHPVARALEVVAPRAPAPVRGALHAAVLRRHRGLAIDRCLTSLGDELGTDAGGLIDVLRRSASSGAPLVPLLHEVSVGARELRRRSAEAAARQLPITLLLPLAGCILPAAVLLAVVPVVVVSLASLR